MFARTLACSLLTFAGAALASPPADAPCQHPAHQHPADVLDCFPAQAPKVEVVFVIDTTGSMGGLIEGAKQKVWSIATAVAQAQPSPEIRMGLVAYRDRGDDYITKRTDLTDDLDSLYSDLMRFEARGGGDTPESVNEALYEAVERFDWTAGPGVLRIVYLVGDAPPKMNYDDDVKYQATCRFAREKGIVINAIQCGGIAGTRAVWQAIAQNAGGAYAAIPQDGGVQAIATPYDQQIADLDRELASLMIDYGDRETPSRQADKRELSGRIAASAAPEAAADRALYNQSGAGASNLYGRQELVQDLAEGKITLESVPAEHLPATLREKPAEEIAGIVKANQARRDAINAEIAELAAKRAKFRRSAAAEVPADAFDAQVLAALRTQAAAVGLEIEGAE